MLKLPYILAYLWLKMGVNLARSILADLLAWARRGNRKPLVLRGARQVGKSTIVNLLAEALGLELITLDFERSPALAQLFASNNPKSIIPLVALQIARPIQAGKCLLFLDEIQAAPSILATLRYFYEEMPELQIICAGSLLEFALEEPSFSMPVGRIEYMYLGPLSFEEFLLAMNESLLVDFLKSFQCGENYPLLIHEKLLRLLKEYMIIGGMPEAIKTYVVQRDFMEVERTKNTILSTYQDDFSKYCKDKEELRLRDVFERISQFISQKVQYSKILPDVRSMYIALALKKLTLAKVIYLVKHSACNGVPLGAEINDKIFKILFLDIGLLSTQLKLSFLDLNAIEELIFVNQGVLAEQFIGQHLLYDHLSYEIPNLYYWQREKPTAQAEVDYVISQRQQVFPVEVKAGAPGTMRSLQLFLKEKQLSLGVRFCSLPPKLIDSDEKNPYKILSLPLYMVGQVRRLIAMV